jgi:Calcineurin-like phosphoesterase
VASPSWPGPDPPTPAEIVALRPEEADALFDRLEREVPVSPALVHLPAQPFHEAVAFGDTHGDYRSTEGVAARFLEAPTERLLVGLGDYVDRAPPDCPHGSVANALYLLGLCARYPDRVVLVKGNHELDRVVGVMPHTVPEEVEALWGSDGSRADRLMALLERGPFAAVSPSGVYFAHGGFPRRPKEGRWESLFDAPEAQLTEDIAWGECGASRARRLVTNPFTEPELEAFLARSGTRLFLRGHDPDLTGQWVFSRRCLTLHTSRSYARFGGVLYAEVPLDRAIQSAVEVTIGRLPSEPAPGGPRPTR